MPTTPLAGRLRLVAPNVAVGQLAPGQTPAGPVIVCVSVIDPVKLRMLESTTAGVAVVPPSGRERYGALKIREKSGTLT